MSVENVETDAVQCIASEKRCANHLTQCVKCWMRRVHAFESSRDAHCFPEHKQTTANAFALGLPLAKCEEL